MYFFVRVGRDWMGGIRPTERCRAAHYAGFPAQPATIPRLGSGAEVPGGIFEARVANCSRWWWCACLAFPRLRRRASMARAKGRLQLALPAAPR